MNDLIINVEKSTRMVLMTKTTVGNDMENLQERIIFKFTDTFVDGQARLEYKIGSTKNYIELTKENNTYILPIQNVLTKEGKIEMQLVITEGESEEHIPVFKSNVFYLYCNRSLNAVSESPEGYDLWIEQANAKLNAMDEALQEVDNLDIDASKSGDTATISITNKEGTTKTVEVKDGIDGQQGETGPANTLSIGTVIKGENASATITGESPNQTLNLVLPKGDKGDKGNTGATGNDGYSPSASVTQLSGGATITITDKTGTTTATITSGEQGPTGPTGPAGKDGKDGKDGTNGVDGTNATINGVSTLTIEAGTNISLDQQGSTLTINATGGSGGTSDYTQLTNKPSINNVTLNGNKSLNDLGIQPKGNYIEDNNYVHTDNNFNNTYKNKLEGLENYDDTEIKATLPTTTGEGQDITLDKTAEMEFVKPPLPMGNSEQNGEPRPDNEVPITNVTGNVEVTISNENNTESKTLPVSLGNIELCKIGNYQDYLYKNNGKWYKYNAINKLVLNGSENWSVHGSIASWFFWDGITDGFTDNTISGYALSNYFTQKPYSTVTSLKNGEFAYGQVAGDTRKRFVIKDTDYTTVANFKSWLSTHNTIVYYVLATPTSTEITDTTLISQLEAINNALSYEEQTNISNNQIALFNVEAYQDTKLILEDINAELDTKVSNTDYATGSVGGVVKVSNGDYGIAMDDGVLKGTVRTYAQYNNMSSKGIVCKGTLENVLTDRIGDVETILTRLTTGGGVS